MAQQNSFDIVSQVDSAEVVNALNQTLKEVRQRFDFKGSSANVVLEKHELVLSAEDETKLRNMNDILQQKLVRRGVPLKAFTYGKVEPAAGGTVRQRAQIRFEIAEFDAIAEQLDLAVHPPFAKKEPVPLPRPVASPVSALAIAQ